MNKASCLSLLSNAVLVWNTVHIARIVAQLCAADHEVNDDDLARLSPLMHAHVIPNGGYFQSPDNEPQRPNQPSPETMTALANLAYNIATLPCSFTRMNLLVRLGSVCGVVCRPGRDRAAGQPRNRRGLPGPARPSPRPRRAGPARRRP